MSTGDIVYTDVGPNTARSVSQQNFTFLLDDRVQYEEIRHNAEATVFEAPTSGEISGIQKVINLAIISCGLLKIYGSLTAFPSKSRPPTDSAQRRDHS